MWLQFTVKDDQAVLKTKENTNSLQKHSNVKLNDYPGVQNL